MNARLERKNAARREREEHVPTPCLASPLPLQYRIVRQLQRRPIDRVARAIVRAKRKIRRASGILAKLHPSSKFAPPLRVDIAINQLWARQAQAELDYRRAIAIQPR